MSITNRHISANFLLSQLMVTAQSDLSPLLRVERLEQGTTLTRRLQPVGHVWFPLAGLVSLMIVMRDGRMVEAAAIGREGAVGLEAACEPSVALSDAVVQIGGDFCVTRVAALRSAVATEPPLAGLLLRRGLLLTAELQQLVACSNLHRLEERCCRWLVTAHERSGFNDLPVTQERLAGILGAARPGVSLILGGLERDGLIRQARSRLQIVSHDALISRVCECYGIMKQMTAKFCADLPEA
jgi:CRP-like cAMP-binding protein